MIEYHSFNPTDLIISGGHEKNEKISIANDTVSVSLASMITPRRGAYGFGNNSNSWLIAGFDTKTTERLDHSNLSQVAVPGSDLPTTAAGGTTLYGDQNAFLCGGAFSSSVYIFSTATELATLTSPMPLRVRDCAGARDSDVGWCPGGVRTDGVISNGTQKVNISTSTWTNLSTLDIIGGRARHSTHYRNHNLYMCGGILSSGGGTSSIILLDTSTDVSLSMTRCSLSTGRDFIGGGNNLEYGWSVGGNNMGATPIVDRIDFSNDTTDSQYRTNLLNPRYYAICVGKLEFSSGFLDDHSITGLCYNGLRITDGIKNILPLSLGLGPYSICTELFLGGGQNYDILYNSIDKLDTTADTTSTEANSTLTRRYGLVGLSNQDYSWFNSGIVDINNTTTNITEKFQHANQVVAVTASAASPHAFSNGASTSFLDKGFVKNGTHSYSFDFTTESWTVLTDYGGEIFQAGCGIGPYALFAGGTIGSERSNDVYKYDSTTNIWTTAINILAEKRSGSAASANSENVWYAGGSRYGSTNQIERFDVFTSVSTSIVRAFLSSSKQRFGSHINQDYIWYSGGFRTSALSDIDRYDYFNDTVSAIYRGPLNTPRHSFGSSSSTDFGIRTFSDRFVRLYVSQTIDRTCLHYGSRASTTTNAVYYPVENFFDQRYIRLKTLPWVELSQRNATLKSGELYTSDVNMCMSYGTHTDLNSYSSAAIPAITIKSTGLSNFYTARPITTINPAKMWIAGGTNLTKLESTDQNTGWSVRGQLTVGRTYAAGVSSLEEAWFGGGAVDNIIEHLDYSNDTGVLLDVADLSVNRIKLMATQSHQYGWFWSGEKIDGVLTGVIDRLDKDNYTVQAISRAYETNRKGAKGDTCGALMYGIGGMNSVSNLATIVSLSPDNDTSTHAVVPFPKLISSHTATSWDDNCIYIQHYSDIWKYDISNGGFTVNAGIAYYRTNGTSARLDSVILLAGGSHNSYTKYCERFDVSNGICEVHGETIYAHNNSWSVCERAFITQLTPNVICKTSAVATDITDLLSFTPSPINSASRLESNFSSIAEISSSLKSLGYGMGGCAITPGFGKTWIHHGTNCFMLDSPDGTLTAVADLPILSNRTTSFSNADYGWFIGGTNSSGCRLSYWDGVTTTVAGPTDINIEFSCGLSQVNRGILFGGVSNTATLNVMNGTNAIRTIDFATETWTFLTPFLMENLARASVAQSGNLGFLLGGDRGASWDRSDRVIKIDMTTDTNSDTVNQSLYPFDLVSGVTRDDSNILLSNGWQYYPSVDTFMVLPTVSFLNRHGSTWGCGAHESVLLCGKDQRYSDPLNLGDIYSGGNSVTTMEYFDQSNDTITYLPGLSPIGLSENSALSPYSFCRPYGRGSGLIDCCLRSYGRYNSALNSVAYKDYTYSDIILITECQDHGESTISCYTLSVEEGVRRCIVSGADTISNSRTGTLHNAVAPHNNDQIVSFSAADTVLEDLLTFIRWEQAGITRLCYSASLAAERLMSTRTGFMYSGGPFNDLRCIVSPSFDLTWSYIVNNLPTTIFSKTIDRGVVATLLEKKIFEDLTSIDLDQIIKDLQSKYGNLQDVVYLIETKESTKFNTDILIYKAIGLRQLTLLINTSDPYFLFRISNEQDFVVHSDKKYPVNGSRIIPMMYGTQLLRIIFDEPPLLVGERIDLELSNQTNRISIRLGSM